jgi:hypothetical protein
MKKLLRFIWAFIIVCCLLGTAGCAKKLVGTTISGIITEAGKPVGIDFPASKITLMQKGSIIETLEIAQSQQNWKFITKPGIYQLEVESAGRRLKVPVDTSKGSVLGLKLNFDTVVIYGEVMLEGRPVTRATGPVRLDLLRDGSIIETKELTGNYGYQFIVPSGQYRLRAFAGSQEVEVAVNAALSCNRSIDLAGELTLTGSITELGATLDQNWPGGTITVKTPDGRVARTCDIVPGQSVYELVVWPSKYTVIAESCGRKVETNVDLSEKDGQFTLDFTDIVLFGALSGDGGTPSCTIKVKKDGTTIKEQTFNDGASGYYFVLSPNAKYTLETSVPSLGSLRVKDISVGRSTKHDINLTEKVTVTGQVYENQYLPTAGEFPIGTVVLKDANGIKRAEGRTDNKGMFSVQSYYGAYTIEVESYGRMASTAADLTDGPKEATLNYTDIVLTGEFKLGTESLPADFPEATIEFVSGGATKKTVTLSEGRSTFTTVVPGGSYTLKMTLKDHPANVEYTIPGELKTSGSKVLNIEGKVAKISGTVRTKEDRSGTPDGPVTVKIFRANTITALESRVTDSTQNYGFYVDPGYYDIQISSAKYCTEKASSIWVDTFKTFDPTFLYCYFEALVKTTGPLYLNWVSFSVAHEKYYKIPADGTPITIPDYVVYFTKTKIDVNGPTTYQYVANKKVKIGEDIYVWFAGEGPFATPRFIQKTIIADGHVTTTLNLN